jgi:two-component system CheB/CheR fusion protein
VGLLSRLVNDLLDLTRISRGKVRLHLVPVELTGLLRQTAADHAPLFDAHDVRLELALGDTPLWMEADPARLAQAVGNLLANAVKFSRAGGRVTVSVERDAADRAVVKVRDEGVGIAPELLGHLFEPFTQADTTLDRTRSGLGLGLSLVRDLVTLHGGAAAAPSEGPGRGAELVLWLPLRPELAAAAAPPAPAPPPPPPEERVRRRVLVIEDNEDAAEMLREMLLLWGHEVEVAHGGREGLARARRFKPEVVLCDLGLPELDGYAVAQALRADPELGSAFRVALTGYASLEDRRRAIAAGFHRHLAKPVPVDVLEELLSSAPRLA